MASQATVGALRVTLGLDSAAFTEGLTAAQRHLRGVGQRMQSVGRNMAMVGAGMTAAITAPLVAFGANAARAAADAEELQSAFNYSFGEMAGDMNAWAQQTGDALGRSTQAIQQAAFTFNQLFSSATPVAEISTELSQRFAVLAQDLASFYNVTEDDALQKLRSGLVGEAEPLRAFGVFLNAAAVEAKALEMGLGGLTGELSEQDKILARAQLIWEATADAQGDLARTSGSATNQMRAMRAQFEELSVAIGQMLLPVITPIVQALNRMMQGISNLSPGMQQFIVIGAAVAAALGPLAVAAGVVTMAIGALLPVIGAIAVPLLAVGAAVGAVVAAFALFGDQIIPVLQQFGARAQEVLGPQLSETFEAVRAAVQAIGAAFSQFLSSEAGQALAQFAAAYQSVMGEALINILNGVLNAVETVFTFIADAVNLVAALLRGDWQAAWNSAVSLVTNLLTGLWETFEAIFPGLADYLRGVYEGAVRWLRDGLGAIFDWVVGRVRLVGDAFRDLWDRVVGNSYIPDMVEAIGEWMGPRLQAAMVDPALEAIDQTGKAFDGLAADVDAGMDGLLRSIMSKDWKGALGGILDILAGQGGAMGAIGSIGGAILGALPGFKTGGSFKVGGSGGPDSQVTAFRSTPGEMVDVRRPGQGGGGMGGELVVRVVPNDERFDAYVDKRVGPAIAASHQSAVSTAEGQVAGRMAESQRRAWR